MSSGLRPILVAVTDWGLSRGGPRATQRFVDTVGRIPRFPASLGRVRQKILNLPTAGQFRVKIEQSPVPFWYHTDVSDSFNLYCRMQFADYEPVTRQIFRHVASVSDFTIDVGAYSGLYSLEAAKANPFGKVWAFEPMASPRALLLKNVEANALGDQVTVWNFALSDRAETAGFYLNAKKAWSTRASLLHWDEDKDGLRIDVDTQSLDVIRDNFPSPVDLIKVDVEGAETLVLEGGRNTITEDKPVLFTEALTQDSLTKQISLLTEFGYGHPHSFGSAFESDDRNYMWVHPQKQEEVRSLLGTASILLK